MNNGIKKVIAIYPGRFHPLHKGHIASFKQLAGNFGLPNTFLAISNKQENGKSPFSPLERAKMAMVVNIPKQNIITVTNPYKPSEYIERFKKAGYDVDNTALVFGVSKKDMQENPRFSFEKKQDGTPSYFQPYNKNTKMFPMTKHAYIFTTDTQVFNVLDEKIDNSTTIRQLYSNADDNKRKKMLLDLYGQKGLQWLKPIFDNRLAHSMNENIKNLILKIKPLLNEATVEQRQRLEKLLIESKQKLSKSNITKKKVVESKKVNKIIDYLPEK